MFSIIYERIINYIKNNYKEILILIIIVFICLYELPFAIYAPGGIVPLDNRITISDKYDSDGSFNMSYVSMIKGTLPLLLLSFIIPNWDIVSKDSITYNNESINELLEFERLQLKSSIANATVIAYEAAGKTVTIKNKKLYVISVTEQSNTNVKRYDELIKIDGITITSLDEVREIVNNHKDGDKLVLEVLRNNKELECSAVVYKEEDTLLMGIIFLELYEYETDPPISVKTKKSEAGSSGGLMLSLAIYNSLIEEDITRGQRIVGTGTIEQDGEVGEIGGVKYKLLGAVKKKADMFICPIENYDEAMKYKEKFNIDIPIYGVHTFEEALSVIKE